MPQSLDNVLLHLIFSTKGREPFVNSEVKKDLYRYLAATCRKSGCRCVRIGGTEDHVHMAIKLARTKSVASLVKDLKSSSSKWMKTQGVSLRGFAWQKGYAVLSVGSSGLEPLVAYIDGQMEHHRKRSFQEEFRELMVEHGVEFDERYVWD